MTILTLSYWFHQKEIHYSRVVCHNEGLLPLALSALWDRAQALSRALPWFPRQPPVGEWELWLVTDPEGIWRFLWKYKEKWHLFKLGKSSLFQIRKMHKSIERFSVWSLGVFLEGAWILSKKALSRDVYYNQVSNLREKYNLLVHCGHWHPEPTETTFSVIFI